MIRIKRLLFFSIFFTVMNSYSQDSLAVDSLVLEDTDSVNLQAQSTVQESKEPAPKEILIDEITAIVGGEIILASDLEIQLQQLVDRGITIGKKERCMVWEELLYQKLLLHRAELDSVEVSEREVDQEIDKRLRYLLGQMGGSEVEFEKYFGRSVLEFKDEMRPIIYETLQAKRMQANVAKDVEISPAEVEAFYRKIPKDSLPVVPEQYKVAQIMIAPKVSPFERERVYKELQSIRKELLNGKDFGLMALLHSQDPGSRNKKGELGYVSRDQLVPSFSAVAFNLKVGEISEIVESEYGYHLIQVLERKGSFINVRHILLTPKIYSTDIEMAQQRMDSVLQVLERGEVSFGKLAAAVSDDPRTNENGGVMINYQTGEDYFAADELEEELYFAIQNLQKGQLSKPEMVSYMPGKSAFRVLKLVDKVDFHVASIERDYSQIKKAALEKKKDKAVRAWISAKVDDTYIKLPDFCGECSNLSQWTHEASKL